MSGLFSKVLAGGLSAGVFLLWWPAHVSTTGNEWLFVRGILWSLAFELLLLAYRPVEQAIAGAVRERRPRTLGTARGARLLTLAVLAVAIPGVMLAGSHPPAPAAAHAAAPKVIVKRTIVRREVVVRRVNHIVRVPAPAATSAAASPTANAPTAVPARAAATAAPTATQTTAKHTTAASRTTSKTAESTTRTPSATTTATTPAATSSAKQPTTAAGPSTSAGATTASPSATASTAAGTQR